MITTLYSLTQIFLYSSTDSASTGAVRGGSSRQSSTTLPAGVGAAVLIVFLAFAVLYYIGVCTIFARANPKLPTPAKILVFILLLFVGDIYILYFVLRMGINGIRGTVDYKTLPYPVSNKTPKRSIG
jgi:hypothetical protein